MKSLYLNYCSSPTNAYYISVYYLGKVTSSYINVIREITEKFSFPETEVPEIGILHHLQ